MIIGKIEHNFPIPSKTSRGVYSEIFKNMKVGDSFLVTVEDGEDVSAVRLRIQSSFKYLGIRNMAEFMTRTVQINGNGKGIRIWRIK